MRWIDRSGISCRALGRWRSRWSWATAILMAGSPAAAQIGSDLAAGGSTGAIARRRRCARRRRRIDNLFLPADRAILQQLGRARKWLDQGHYSDAIECLDKILESPDDYFFQPDKQVPTHRSLKAEAQRLLGQMPREGRELYELHSGGNAQRMLDEAVAAGDATKLAAASGRYFHTRAGYEATFLLGLYDLDHGLPLAGALTLRRLREAPAAGDRFEPALTLAMAAGWLEAGCPRRRSGRWSP